MSISLVEAVRIVHAELSESFDMTMAEAVEHARNTLILPDATWVPGAFRLALDGHYSDDAYVAVLTASRGRIATAVKHATRPGV